MTFASHAIFPAPPASGADLLDGHWAVDAMPAARRSGLLAAALPGAIPLTEPHAREQAHTLATAYELAALLGRDALRSGSGSTAATLEREALRLGAERAGLLHRALGLPPDLDAEGVLRHAVRLCALAAVAGPVAVAETRAWFRLDDVAQRLEQAAQATSAEGEQAPRGAAATLWIIWRRLLLHPDADAIEELVARLAALREERRGVPDLTPSTNEADLRARFLQFVRDRLADAAGLLALGLRGRGDPAALANELTAHCTAARSASTGDPNLDLLAAWLELAALSALAPRRTAAL